MDEETARKRATVRTFDAAADGYLASDTHRQGTDLDRLASWCSGATRALDVATGAGHTARAITEEGVPNVVAIDAAPSMVATTTAEVAGVVGCIGDAERLPFAADAFDAVACRIAAHHFPDPVAFVAEVARILRPGGTFALEDNVAPEDEALGSFLDRFERARDPTHVESYPTSTWRRWLDEAGFAVEETAHFAKRIEFDAWVDRIEPEDRADRDAIADVLLDAPTSVERAFDVRVDGERVRSFAIPKALIRGVLAG